MRQLKVKQFVVLSLLLIFVFCSQQTKEQFDIYLLIGQSNMAGRGHIEQQDTTAIPGIVMLNKENQWVPAKDPLHFDKPIAGVGPGLTFAKIMAAQNQHSKIGLVPCAAGGSSIDRWKQGEFHDQTNSHPYDDAIKRARIAQKSGKLQAILWHQGESDSHEEKAPYYKEKLITLIKTIRQDLNADNVPFIMGTLPEFFIEKRTYADTINKSIREIPEQLDNILIVETDSLTAMSDGIHFNNISARTLGERYAKVLIKHYNSLSNK